jgi:putative FmdB family regulatory protein|tara:strand:- start:314 stop:514 length:201 start_codon:yes stop_codon:yes gene_type:complete
MPFYTFKCPSCNKEEELLQGMSDKLPLCKECDLKNYLVEMQRVFKSVGKPKFKGSGFYETDYKGKK